jgi:hypothetical protein
MNEKHCFSLDPIYEKVSHYLVYIKSVNNPAQHRIRNLLNFRIVSRDVYNLSLIPSNKAALYSFRMNTAIRCGDLPVIKWFIQNDRYYNRTYIINMSASKGHLEVLKWMHDNNIGEWSTSAMDRAASKGHLEVVKWLHENRKEGCTTKAMDEAATAGHLDVVLWLHENRYEGCTNHTAMNATKNGHVDVVIFLLGQRDESQHYLTEVLESAIEYGHLEIVKWFYIHEESDDEDSDDEDSDHSNSSLDSAMDSAYRNFDIKMIRYLYERKDKRIKKIPKWQKFLDMNLDDQFSKL